MTVNASDPISVEAYKYTGFAAAHIENLPTHLLGSLSTDKYLLVSVVAFIMQDFEPDKFAKPHPYFSAAMRKSQVRRQLDIFVDKMHDAAARKSNVKVDSDECRQMYIRAWGEAVMWRTSSGRSVPPMDDKIFTTEEWDSVIAWSKLTRAIIENPPYLVYAQLGISDLETIESFASRDIDTSLVSILAGG